MPDSDSASHQLRVIRSLMERATIYRALSAPTALVGGLLSLGGFAVAYYARHYQHRWLTNTEFVVIWMVILVLTGAANAFFIWREARRRDEPFFSSGMKCAFLSLAPAFLLAGIMTICLPIPMVDAIIWITLYGLGLLATQHFAPRSLIVLGSMFFITGCGLALQVRFGLNLWDGDAFNSPLTASWLMGATFGGFHLAYAAALWALGGDRASAPDASPSEAGNV